MKSYLLALSLAAFPATICAQQADPCAGLAGSALGQCRGDQQKLQQQQLEQQQEQLQQQQERQNQLAEQQRQMQQQLENMRLQNELLQKQLEHEKSANQPVQRIGDGLFEDSGNQELEIRQSVVRDRLCENGVCDAICQAASARATGSGWSSIS